MLVHANAVNGHTRDCHVRALIFVLCQSQSGWQGRKLGGVFFTALAGVRGFVADERGFAFVVVDGGVGVFAKQSNRRESETEEEIGRRGVSTFIFQREFTGRV